MDYIYCTPLNFDAFMEPSFLQQWAHKWKTPALIGLIYWEQVPTYRSGLELRLDAILEQVEVLDCKELRELLEISLSNRNLSARRRQKFAIVRLTTMD